jgi:hypothetical protein
MIGSPAPPFKNALLPRNVLYQFPRLLGRGNW